MTEIIRKILIIDDEEANVRVLSLTLRCDGYEVVSALNGEEGLAVFRKESPDLVLTDIKMPGMDGIEVLKHIKEVSPDTEVIIITGHGDIDNAIEALKFGASDFINKPIRDQILAVAIQRAGERLSIKRQLAEYTVTLEQKVQQATQELRRQSNFLTRLIRSSNDGIVAADKDLNIVIFNPGAERIFGYTSEEVIRKQKITDLLPDSLKNIMIPIRRPHSGTEALWQEVTICGKDQSCIPVRLYVTSLTEKEHVMGTVFFFQDLREIKRLEDELVHAERLATIGQTVAGVAHGIKNILHGFKGGSYLVDLGIAKNDQEKLTKGWDMIQRNIVRTSELVLDLLSYSKERALEFEPCEPNRIVQEICDMMQHLAEQYDIELVTDLDPSMNEVYMDPAVVHQCLSNLVSNAVDACLFDHDTSKHYQVRIRTQRCSDGYIRFEIIDNGTGMSPEVRRKLFTSFFSTKGHRGTGLGLLVTRKLIQEHNGTITVASEPGKGTTFVIRLPYAVSKTD
jgi:PAS domain S-box-containing protein